MPKLKKVDLSRMQGCNHDGIDAKSSYLVKVYGDWCAGKFSKQWYGWNFDNWGTSGIQLDSSGITAVYKITGR